MNIYNERNTLRFGEMFIVLIIRMLGLGLGFGLGLGSGLFMFIYKAIIHGPHSMLAMGAPDVIRL